MHRARRWEDLPAATKREWIAALEAQGVDREDTIRAGLQADEERVYRAWARAHPRHGLSSWEPLDLGR